MTDQPGQPGHPDLAPGDAASPDTPNAGEDLCPDCSGSGKMDGGECPTCQGSGTLVEGVGGG